MKRACLSAPGAYCLRGTGRVFVAGAAVEMAGRAPRSCRGPLSTDPDGPAAVTVLASILVTAVAGPTMVARKTSHPFLSGTRFELHAHNPIKQAERATSWLAR